jgi:23S rRNA (guanine745-N1)-methyltransferase
VSCPVRQCGRTLAWSERALSCPRGHAFDRGRSGYVNLLLPQDRRSSTPGDPREVVVARRRSLERGLGGALRDALLGRLGTLGLPADVAMLDVGCGEGYFLRAIADAWPDSDRVGVDLSTFAIDHAAARDRAARWIVANADRRLPFETGTFALVLSITGPKQASELRRLLADGGHLLVAVPAADDLAELRTAVLGDARSLDRSGRIVELFGEHFRVAERSTARARLHLDREALRDAFAASYRAARSRAKERLWALPPLEVTVAHDLFDLVPR